MNADQIINGILDREGGIYTNDPNDPGGPTKWGVTQRTLSEWRGEPVSVIDVGTLERGEAFQILRHRYYVDPGFVKVASLSERIADELTDTGVNCGQAVATIMLQRCLNAFNQGGRKYDDIMADGAVGQATLRALAAFMAWRGADGETVMVAALNCLQGDRYIELAEKSVKFEDFVYGWIKNRVAA